MDIYTLVALVVGAFLAGLALGVIYGLFRAIFHLLGLGAVMGSVLTVLALWLLGALDFSRVALRAPSGPGADALATSVCLNAINFFVLGILAGERMASRISAWMALRAERP